MSSISDWFWYWAIEVNSDFSIGIAYIMYETGISHGMYRTSTDTCFWCSTWLSLVSSFHSFNGRGVILYYCHILLHFHSVTVTKECIEFIWIHLSMDSSSIRTKFWNYFESNLSFNSANLCIRSPVSFVIWNSVELMDGYRTIFFCPYPHISTERS